ncbi:MAG: CAAX prenyl protease-related protein [Bryobacteraceae bacterium]
MAYAAPFLVYIALMAVQSAWPMPDAVDLIARIVIVGAVILAVSRPVLDFRVVSPLGTTAIGVVIFAIWVAPDALIPNYRHFFLFENSITGKVVSSFSDEVRSNGLVIILRILRAALLVPIVEELFWRGWLMRWLIDADIRKVALGAYSASSFWIVAILFAAEHGPFWDVGLIAGILFNVWMMRTRSMGDLILSHAVANGCLSVYVLATGHWEYW